MSWRSPGLATARSVMARTRRLAHSGARRAIASVDRHTPRAIPAGCGMGLAFGGVNDSTVVDILFVPVEGTQESGGRRVQRRSRRPVSHPKRKPLKRGPEPAMSRDLLVLLVVVLLILWLMGAFVYPVGGNLI